MESEPRLYFLFDRIFFTRTGIHFARKCSSFAVWDKTPLLVTRIDHRVMRTTPAGRNPTLLRGITRSYVAIRISLVSLW
jgi:hypothetical protein